MGVKNIHDYSDNFGGVTKIEIAHIDDFLNKNLFRFKDGKYFESISFIPFSAILGDDEKEDDHGIIYTYAGTFKIKKSKFYPLSKFIGKVAILKITDLNGNVKIIGEVDNPVMISRNGDTGSKPTDMAHDEYKFSVSQCVRSV